MSSTTLPKLNKTATDQLIQIGLVVGANLYPDIPTTQAVPKLLENPGMLLFFEAALKANGFPNIDLKASLEALMGLFQYVLPHDNRIVMKQISMTIMTGIMLVVVGLRLYSRRKLTKKLWPEDWWALAAAIGAVVVYITHMLAISYGAAERHIYDVPWKRVETWLMILTITSLIYTVAIVLIKMTFIVFYYRLIPDKGYRRALIGVAVGLVALLLSSIFAILFQCNRVDYWNDYFRVKCIDKVLANTLIGVFTIISDFVLLLLPIWKISSLKIRNRKEKIMVIGMFAAGGLICIANVYRVIAFNDLLKATDASYLTVAMSNWGLLELDLGIVISCLPALKHLLIGNKFVQSVSNLSSRIMSSGNSRQRKPAMGSTILMTETGDGSKIEREQDLEAGVNPNFSKDTQQLVAMQSRGSQNA